MHQLDLIDADMCGNDMISPLKYISEHPQKKDYIKQVFLLTDGEDDRISICAMVQANRDNFRVFTIGIGSDADRNLIIDVARNGSGRYIFIDDEDENMNEKVIELLRLAISYAMMHVCLSLIHI